MTTSLSPSQDAAWAQLEQVASDLTNKPAVFRRRGRLISIEFNMPHIVGIDDDSITVYLWCCASEPMYGCRVDVHGFTHVSMRCWNINLVKSILNPLSLREVLVSSAIHFDVPLTHNH
jgi:hypothetical protein